MRAAATACVPSLVYRSLSQCSALQAVSDTKFADYVPRTAFLFPGQGAQTVGMGKARLRHMELLSKCFLCYNAQTEGDTSCRTCTSKCRQRRPSSTARQRYWVMTC